MKFRLLSRRPPVAVVALREDLDDLRAEVGHLGRQLRALQEREAVLNARVLHLGRYTSGGNGAASPMPQKGPPALIPEAAAVFEGIETSPKERGPG